MSSEEWPEIICDPDDWPDEIDDAVTPPPVMTLPAIAQGRAEVQVITLEVPGDVDLKEGQGIQIGDDVYTVQRIIAVDATSSECFMRNIKRVRMEVRLIFTPHQ